ncbi:unnamed protein product [Adineta ricciae]|uniref:Ubiquitin-like domain-containing protein n=1 Tax=Adineta ricciae TaxID=249248 RepID=A0A815VBH7_ADIRI|nr:unnamed protein product [Adineta ricciae]
MKVILKTVGNIQIPFQVEPSDTFDTFKEQIYHTTGVLPDCQKLIYAGHVCTLFDTFADKNIQDEDQINWIYATRNFLNLSTHDSINEQIHIKFHLGKISPDRFLVGEDPDHMIIWLDRKIDKQQHYDNLINAFSLIALIISQNQPEQTPRRSEKAFYTNYSLSATVATVSWTLEVFSSITDCLRCFDENRNKCIFFITSNTMARVAVPLILEHFQEMFTDPLSYGFHLSIYVFRENTGEQLDWAFEYIKNIQIFDFNEDLFVRLIRDIADYHVAVGKHILGSSPSHRSAIRRRLYWARELYERYRDLENVSLKKEFEGIDALLEKEQTMKDIQASPPKTNLKRKIADVQSVNNN